MVDQILDLNTQRQAPAPIASDKGAAHSAKIPAGNSVLALAL
jgi:hypothetical protein